MSQSATWASRPRRRQRRRPAAARTGGGDASSVRAFVVPPLVILSVRADDPEMLGQEPSVPDSLALEIPTPGEGAESEDPPPSLLAGAGGFTHVVPIVLSVNGVGGSELHVRADDREPCGVRGGTGDGLHRGVRKRIGDGTRPDRREAPDVRLRRDRLPSDARAPDPRGRGRRWHVARDVLGPRRARRTHPCQRGPRRRSPTEGPGSRYSGVVAGFSDRVLVCGLRQDAKDRSNLALLNVGGLDAGIVKLRVTVYPSSPSQGYPVSLPAETLPPGGFKQLSGVLGLAGYSAGWVTVDRSSGTAPFYAYGVVNDQASSDGSYVEPVDETDTLGQKTLVVPVVVESGPFTSELVLTNPVGFERNLTLTFVADGITTSGGAVTTSLALPGTTQIVIEGIVDWLRQRTTGLPPKGTGIAGALFVAGAIVVGMAQLGRSLLQDRRPRRRRALRALLQGYRQWARPRQRRVDLRSPAGCGEPNEPRDRQHGRDFLVGERRLRRRRLRRLDGNPLRDNSLALTSGPVAGSRSRWSLRRFPPPRRTPS